MKVVTDNQGLVQITVEGIAEEQVVRNALEFYAMTKKHENPKHMNLAFDMYESVVEEYVKDVELEEITL